MSRREAVLALRTAKRPVLQGLWVILLDIANSCR